jgi:hypothetical protein
VTGRQPLDLHSSALVSAADHVPQRIRSRDVAWAGERLNERDWRVIEAVNRLRLVRGEQIERLFFAELSGHSKVVTRGRVLRRLVDWQVLDVLPRRVGGSLRGSSGSVYALGVTGQRLLAERQLLAGTAPRVRHVGMPTDRTMRHTLAVSELYTGLVEQVRASDAAVATFDAEPACWWPNGIGGYVKPDAYALLVHGQVRDHWWLEADLATESLPTLKRKLATYLDFVDRGQLGPSGVIPRVLVTVPTEQRYSGVLQLISRLPDPAGQLFSVITERRESDYLLQALRELKSRRNRYSSPP